MRSKIRSYRPSHALVVAYLALFVALGGSSYAAIKVTGKNVQNSSLTGTDIKNDSLNGKDVTRLGTGDIQDASLLAEDFKPGQLPAGAQGPQGPQGIQGAKGDIGTTGRPGATNVRVRQVQDIVAANSSKTVTSPCDDGERATGGGASNEHSQAVNIIESAPSPSSAGSTPTGWNVTYDNTNSSAQSVFVYAVCASP